MNPSQACASPSPAAPQGSAWRWSARLRAAARAWRSSRADASASSGSPRECPGSHGIVGDVSLKDDIYPIAVQILGELGGLDVLINNASNLGPGAACGCSADTDCEDLERALATNLLGPFRLTKAVLGALAASAREGRGAVVVNVSSDAAITPYPTWGAYGASKAALRHLSAIWDAELDGRGRARPVARSGRHGHAAARAGGARRRSGDAEAAGESPRASWSPRLRPRFARRRAGEPVAVRRPS